MADIVPDGFEGKVGVDQALHARVTQRMRSRTTHRDTSLMQVVRGAAGDAITGHRLAGSQCSKEDRALRGLGSAMLQIVQDRLAHDRGQGVGR